MSGVGGKERQLINCEWLDSIVKFKAHFGCHDCMYKDESRICFTNCEYSSILDTLKFQRVAEEVPKGIVAADWRKETLGYGNVHEERARDGKKR